VNFFPNSDIILLAGMTEKALFHRPGILVVKNENGEYESIEEKLNEINEQIENRKFEISQTTDNDKKQGLKSTIKSLENDKRGLLKNAKKLIDLSNKILIFLDTPSERLLSGLLPLLSHDRYEIEYEYVDTHNGIKTKSNVLRGFPDVITAQAIDYSHYSRYQEIQRRFIITNPTMTQEKYNDAINLISKKCSLPDFVYQKEIVSDDEKNRARQIIMELREQIQLLCSNLKPGENNVIIPFNDVVKELLPKEKSFDMTRANRLFNFLSFLPMVYFSERPRLLIRKKGEPSLQIIPFTVFEDLINAISLMEYSNGVRRYVLEWYYEVFVKAYTEKSKPDSKTNSKGEEIKEERIAVTSTDIIKKHKEIHNEILSTKQLLESYLYPLLNQAYIDKINSQIDRRAKIYFPVITTRKYINLFENEKSNNLPRQKQKIIVNSTIYPSKEYIISKIQHIMGYYSEDDYIVKLKNHKDEEISIEELGNNYYNNGNDYFEIDDKCSRDNNKIDSSDLTNTSDLKENTFSSN
ncbi:MAG: hypothetical protein ACPKPY_13190, partial [Nitrososphaeraceae archaeon]